ncbi:MAG: RNA polymerase sigma factor [Eubacterium ramulus]
MVFTHDLINECRDDPAETLKREVTYEEGVLTEEAAQQDYSDHCIQHPDAARYFLQRLPLVMYYFDGFKKYREIADILEVSESAIKMRLNREENFSYEQCLKGEAAI